jgi:hypothetical protein
MGEQPIEQKIVPVMMFVVDTGCSSQLHPNGESGGVYETS